ncbi:MAG: lysine exporter LysO family protein [Theionarchaea archaeon]|nr:lysine exporter LysO family protein [Theionarchaea archaeon]MBU7038774.1 lysine exporter LysO family protein [Theionarchaea archaeon]
MIAMIVSALVIGVLVGFFNIVPETALGGVTSVSQLLLIALLFLVGIDVGANKEVLIDLKRMGVRILALPLAITAGSLLGGVVLSVLLGMSIYESLAVASGMGYYTLSSIILTQAVGTALGTLAFLSNIFREILTVVTSPGLARISRLAPVASGGATSMDTTLPVIIQCTSKTVGVLAVISGVIITLLVPFLVSLFARFIR